MAKAPKMTSDEIIAMIQEKELEMARELKREQLNKSLIRLLKKAEKDGFHLNTILFAHMQKETERFYFADYAMHV